MIRMITALKQRQGRERCPADRPWTGLRKSGCSHSPAMTCVALANLLNPCFDTRLRAGAAPAARGRVSRCPRDHRGLGTGGPRHPSRMPMGSSRLPWVDKRDGAGGAVPIHAGKKCRRSRSSPATACGVGGLLCAWAASLSRALGESRRVLRLSPCPSRGAPARALVPPDLPGVVPGFGCWRRGTWAAAGLWRGHRRACWESPDEWFSQESVEIETF